MACAGGERLLTSSGKLACQHGFVAKLCKTKKQPPRGPTDGALMRRKKREDAAEPVSVKEEGRGSREESKTGSGGGGNSGRFPEKAKSATKGCFKCN